MTGKDRNRFWLKVRKTRTCWLWTAYVGEDGYGQFWLRGRNRKAHVVAYEDEDEIPDGLELDHTCRVRACVRRSHLEPVTHIENVRRGNAGQARKTICKRGHKLTGEKNCRQCNQIRVSEWRSKQREVVNI